MNASEIKVVIRETPCFSILDEQDADRLFCVFDEVEYSLGKNVCQAGEQGEAFYIIAAGRARAVGQDEEGHEVTLDTLGKGAHFGEQALLTGEPWEFTIRSAGDLKLYRLPKNKFLKLLEENSNLRNYFADYISHIAIRNFIKQCTVFSPISPKEMKQVLDSFVPQSYNPGERIITEGEKGDAFYLIRSGEVNVVKESVSGRVINRLGEGDFVGELALLTDAPRAASVIAKSPVTAFRLDREAFNQIIDSIPQIKDAILGVAAGYSRRVRELMVGDAVVTTDSSQETVMDPPSSAKEDKEETEEAKPFTFKRSRKFPILLQQSEADCGAACLAMICRYYGVTVSINRTRELANVTRTGATLYSLAEAGEALGFQTQGLQADFDYLLSAKLPAIAHWQGIHYIVVISANESGVEVADPACGTRRFDKDEFIKGWTGHLLHLNPTPQLYEVEPSKSTFARFIPFVTAHSNLLAKIFLVSLIIQIFGLATPLFTQSIVDQVLVTEDVLMLNVMLAGMLVVAFFKIVTSALRQYMLVFTTRQIDLSLLIQFYNHLLGLPIKYFEDRKVGDIISRFKENEKIRELLTATTLSVIMDFFTMIVYLSLMFYYNVKLAVAAILFVPIFVIFTLLFTPIMKKTSRETFQAGAASQSYLVESINGINTVKALAVEQPIRWKWEKKMTKFLNLKQKRAMIGVAADSTGGTLQTLSTTLILWYGAMLVINGELTVGQLMAFNILLGSAIGPIMRIVGLWDQFQEARVALERINDVIEAKLESGRLRNGLVMPPVKGHILFKNLSFRYNSDDPNVLQNIDLEIGPGQTVALVGRSGSGKTTLTNLLLRLHQPTEGEIFIDGLNLKSVVPVSLRRQIGVVLQENFLFSGTIKENISLQSPDPSIQDVITASMLAGAHEFISELPLGYETVIGERGMNLSGGQRQRIAIARALFCKPKILVLDEATSALDTESERIIQQNLDSILQDRTTFVIAHRLSTVRNADLIVVLDRGLIVEKGTHFELMERKGLYYFLNSQQIGA